MYKKIKCFLANLLGKEEWHDWEDTEPRQSEYEPTLYSGATFCKHCGKFKSFYSFYKEKIEDNNSNIVAK